MRLVSTGLPSRIAFIVAVCAGVICAPPSAAKPQDDPAKPEDAQVAPAQVRTISLDINPGSFKLETINVEPGETVQFLLRNTSDAPHDFTIGTQAVHEGRRAMLDELHRADALNYHSKLSTRYDSPSSVVVLPGRIKLLKWKFTETQDLYFTSNLPGDDDLRIRGKFVVAAPETMAWLEPSLPAPPKAVEPEAVEPEDVEPEAVEPVAAEPETAKSPVPALEVSAHTALAPKIEPDKPATVRAERPKPIAQEPPKATDPGPKKSVAVRTQVVPFPVRKPRRVDFQPQGTPPPPPSEVGRSAPTVVLQLAAVKSASEAEAVWKRLSLRHAEVLRDREHFVVRADLGALGVVYRLRVRGFTSRSNMLSVCEAIRTRGGACVGIAGAQAEPVEQDTQPAALAEKPAPHSLR